MDSNCDEQRGANLSKIVPDIDIRASKPHDYILINISTAQASPRHQNQHTFILSNFLKSSINKITSTYQKAIDSILHTHLTNKISFNSSLKQFQQWIKHPLNSAFLLWLTCVAISATMLGLLLLGLLNNAFPSKKSRNRWIEIDNQVLNALFTLMSLYQHPNLFHHLVLLFRWRSKDVIELRQIYSKNGQYRPHERAHMAIVITLLHITCISQYVSCGLFWGYLRKSRPELAQTLSFAVGTVSPIIAGLYTVYSPLGGEMGIELKHEEEMDSIEASDKYDIVMNPKWKGGLFDCVDDKCTFTLSVFCTFCVFGWNMQRLGFGNMYVHMVTFCLLCVAPFWIFSISALNISNDVVRGVLGITGLVLCLLGLVYGGFWRIKMREKFGIIGSNMNDYVKWVFCWSCALAQEVRTVNFYDVENDDGLDVENENTDDGSCELSDADMMAPVQEYIGSSQGGRII